MNFSKCGFIKHPQGSLVLQAHTGTLHWILFWFCTGENQKQHLFLINIPFLLWCYSLSTNHREFVFYPHGKGWDFTANLGYFVLSEKTRNTPNVPVAPAGRESSQIYSSGRQTPPAVGKVNLIHLSPSITDSALIQNIHCFSPSSDRKEPIAQARNQTSVSQNKDINLQVSVTNQ